MQCFYINLPRETGRRKSVERQFEKYANADDYLTRIEAIDPNSQAIQQRKGTARNSQKSVYLSHLKAIARAEQHKEPCLIMEDDVKIFANTLTTIKTILTKLKEKQWDLIYTDVIVTTLQGTNIFYRQTRAQRKKKRFKLLPLNNHIYAGATGYIINPNSITRIIGLLSSHTNQDAPWDMILRHHIRARRISGYVTVPFLTTVTEEANKSANQLNETQFTDEVWNTVRRLLANQDFIEKKELRAAVHKLGKNLTEEEELFGKLMACYLCKNYKQK
jgi:GR25 family glycosyltransferase involved in LPS biosynthesis